MNFDNLLQITLSASGIFCEVFADDNTAPVLTQEMNLDAPEKSFVDLLQDFFSQNQWNIPAENVRFVIENSDYMLIPSELFHENDIPKMAATALGQKEDVIYYFDVLPKWKLHLVYGLDKKTADFIAANQKDAEVEHVVFILLKEFINKNINSVYLNVRKNTADIALINENVFQLFNSFTVKTPEDICYFVLNVYEQFKLNIGEFKLKVKKNKHLNQSTIELLKKYVSNVEV